MEITLYNWTILSHCQSTALSMSENAAKTCSMLTENLTDISSLRMIYCLTIFYEQSAETEPPGTINWLLHTSDLEVQFCVHVHLYRKISTKKSPILLTEKLFCLVSELTPRSNKRPVFVCCNFSRPLSSLPVNICSASCAGVLRVHVTFLSSLVVLDHFNAAGNYDRGIPKIKQITEWKLYFIRFSASNWVTPSAWSVDLYYLRCKSDHATR